MSVIELHQNFFQAYQFLPDAVLVADHEYNLLSMNRAAEILFKCNSQDWIGRSLEKIVGDGPDGIFRPEIREIIKNDGYWHGETTFSNNGNPGIELDYTLQRIDHPDYVPFAILAIARDNSAAKRLERALHESEERFRLFSETAQEIFYERDLATGIAVFYGDVDNPLGYPPGGYPRTNEGWVEHLHPDDLTRVVAAYNDFVFSGKDETSHVEFRLRHTDQTYRYWVDRGRVIRDADGLPRTWRGVVADISAYKTAQAHEQRLLSFVENSKYLIAISNMDGEITYFNRAGLELLGGQANATLSVKTIQKLMPEVMTDMSNCQAWIQLNKEGSLTGFTAIASGSDNLSIEVEYTAFLVQSSEFAPPTGIAVTMYDIREKRAAEENRKRLEAQLAQALKMEAIGRLAGGIAHDFNNLLTGISGYAEILLSNLSIGDPMFSDLNEIKKASDRAASLTAQLLAFSRKQVIAPKIINLNELLDGSTKMLKRLIGEDIELIFHPGKDLGVVKVDPHQIEQILINLTINARDAMPNGGKLIVETANIEIDEKYVATHIDAKPGSYIRLSVSDNGHGIPPEIKAHLFEPFFTSKEMGKGTGLGLSMIYGIIQQNGGFINVYSEVEIGTTFTVYLPRVAGKAEAFRKSNMDSLPIGTETILLVEDEEMVRNLAQKILQGLGYQVLSVEHGGKAFVLAKDPKIKIDLLLTDVIMPDINGRQLFESIHSLRPELRVLYMSGYTEDAIAHHGVLDEDTNFIQKPFTIANLSRKVRELLDSRKRQE